MLRIPAAAAALVIISLAGCGASHADASSPSHSAGTHSPSRTAPSPQVIHGNILIPASAAALKPGPFRIIPVHCGRYTPAQRNALGTTAAGGLVYRFTNTSASLNGQPIVDVQFLDGRQVAGENVAGSGSGAGPGQGSENGVDAVGGSGQNLRFTSCQLVSYAVETGSSAEYGDFAP
jgi:hypothetical protein